MVKTTSRDTLERRRKNKGKNKKFSLEPVILAMNTAYSLPILSFISSLDFSTQSYLPWTRFGSITTSPDILKLLALSFYLKIETW